MYTPELLSGLVNLVATGSSLLLLHRGPSPRLRRLILAAGIMTMAQLSVIVYSGVNGLALISSLAKVLVGIAALYSLRLLYEETHERKLAGTPFTHIAPEPEPHPRSQPVEPVEPSHWLQPSAKTRNLACNLEGIVIQPPKEPAVEPCTTDLLALARAVGTSGSPLFEADMAPIARRDSEDSF